MKNVKVWLKIFIFVQLLVLFVNVILGFMTGWEWWLEIYLKMVAVAAGSTIIAPIFAWFLIKWIGDE